MVVCAPDGRLDLPALTRRIAGASRGPVEAPATYVVFDALTAGGTDLRGYPYRVRRAVLEELVDGAPPPLALVPMTTDGDAARVWLTEHLAAGIEGVVAKRLDHAYAPGTRAWSKIRGRTSAEAIVGGVLGPIAMPVALVSGRPDGTGRLRVVGRAGTISRDVRPALGAVLRPATEGHPWPAVLPPARFGNVGPVEYTRVKPSVVVELAVDAAVDIIRGRPVWRHVAQFQRVRAELNPMDLSPLRSDGWPE